MEGSKLFLGIIAMLYIVASETSERDLTSDKTTIFLFTRSNRGIPVVVKPYNDTTLGFFNESNDVKYITHGYKGDGQQQWINDTKDALLNISDMNIFVIDWAPLAIIPYQRASRNASLVGEYLGAFIQYLISKGSSYGKQHLIGWSLGGQVVGFAGAYVGGQVARISSLDPAYPEFEDDDPSSHLDATDGIFVDVIHTNTYRDNGTPIPSQGISFEAAVGHVDFYPNGGHTQKGCEDSDTDSCSHGRAPEFFVESVRNPNAFLGYKCGNYSQYNTGTCFGCSDSCSQMGYNANPNTGNGIYYFATRDNYPYTGKQLFVGIEISDNQINTTGRVYLTLYSAAGSDRAAIIDKSEEITPGNNFAIAIAVFETLFNFTRGSLEFAEGKGTLVSINSIKVWDPYTNQRICSTPADINDGSSANVTFNNCQF